MKSASTFPTLLERFFMDRLMRQRQVSPRNTPLRKETIAVLRSWLQEPSLHLIVRKARDASCASTHAGDGLASPRRFTSGGRFHSDSSRLVW